MNGSPADMLPTLTKPVITVLQLQAYAEASLDNNPIHLDSKFAKEAGFPSVIAHGMISMAFLADYVLSQFPESQYTIRRMKTRFRKVTLPGDQLTCEGRIKDRAADGTLTVTVHTRNPAGDITADGEAELRPH